MNLKSEIDPISSMPPAIVTVIEAGPLEHQVCLLAESIRRWGGRLSDAKIVAVKPRLGPNISRGTRAELDRLSVEYCQIDRDDDFRWFPYLNKTAAVRYVSARHPGTIIWLDADTLVLNEPSQLMLDANDLQGPRFAACASDKNIGTTNDDDEYAPYFQAACRTLGIDYASLPYVVTEQERVPIRAYWNSGVYAFAGSSGLADLHHKFTLALLAHGVASRTSQLFFTDQISLGLAAHDLRLPRRELPASHNFSVQPEDVKSTLQKANADIRILHYHGCLWPNSFNQTCEGLDVHYRETAEWLRRRGPLVNGMPVAARVFRKFLELHRMRLYNSALRRATYY